MEKMKDAKLEVFGPMPLTGLYVMLNENEVITLRYLSREEKNNLPIKDIRERMRNHLWRIK